MSYRYLVLLDNWAMTPTLAAKIRGLVAAGRPSSVRSRRARWA